MLGAHEPSSQLKSRSLDASGGRHESEKRLSIIVTSTRPSGETSCRRKSMGAWNNGRTLPASVTACTAGASTPSVAENQTSSARGDHARPCATLQLDDSTVLVPGSIHDHHAHVFACFVGALEGGHAIPVRRDTQRAHARGLMNLAADREFEHIQSPHASHDCQLALPGNPVCFAHVIKARPRGDHAGQRRLHQGSLSAEEELRTDDESDLAGL